MEWRYCRGSNLRPIWLLSQLFCFLSLQCGLGFNTIISLWLNIESSLLSSLTLNGFSSFLFLSDVNTESKSENMIDLLCLFLEMMLRARSMAHTSAVKMELFIGRAFLLIVLLRTAAYAVLLLSLELSVNIYWWSGWFKRIVWNFPDKCWDAFFWGGLFNWRITCGFLMF